VSPPPPPPAAPVVASTTSNNEDKKKRWTPNKVQTKVVSEYGKFTVEGLVGIYDTFKKPAELNK
jgi:hypothetical protein